MVSLRSLWLAAGLVAAVLAIGVLIGAVFGDAGLAVESVTAEGHTPTNASANCDDAVVRQVTVSVTVARDGLGLENPQLWDVGVSVQASVFRGAESKHLSLSPGETGTVAIPFTSVHEDASAPQEHVEAVVQVTHGSSLVDERTVTATLPPVAAGDSC